MKSPGREYNVFCTDFTEFFNNKLFFVWNLARWTWDGIQPDNWDIGNQV